jgi:predicted transcriptional regulator
MELRLNTDLQGKLDQLALETGRSVDELVVDAIAEYFDELLQTRKILNGRYDDLKSGRVKPIDDEAFFESLRRHEEELMNKHAPG